MSGDATHVLPYPPDSFIHRVGSHGATTAELRANFDTMGLALRERICGLLGDDWSWEGKRVLDFGCGSGRLLRAFHEEAAVSGRWVGTDIHAPSIEWINANLPAPFEAVANAEQPPLPFPDGSFDVIFATSVFTHLADNSLPWLIEMHRLLAPDGLLLPTFLNNGGWADFGPPGAVPLSEDSVGMRVINRWQDWEKSGPTVFLSEWWIREHWGRAFAIEHVERWNMSASEFIPAGQGILRARKLGTHAPTIAELEAPSDDRREIAAAQDALKWTLWDVDKFTRLFHIERQRNDMLERQITQMGGQLPPL